MEEKMEAAQDFEQRGFAGVKIFSGRNAPAAEREVVALRATLHEDTFVALDALWSFDLATAVHMGKLLERVGAAWLESPLDPEDLDGHRRLVASTSIPIAVGEVLRTARAFDPWVKGAALGIAQPDLMRCGITGTMEIADLSEQHHVPTTLHVGVSTGVGVAATWQVAAALSSELPQEHQCDLFDTANSVLSTPLIERGGHLEVPARPGIGVEVNEAAVLAHTTEHWIVDRNGRRLAGGEP